MPQPLLELINVTKHYRCGEQPVEVLAGLSLKLEAGESLAVVGPSGCGKSTLLNLIAGLDAPDAGQVLLEGVDLAGRSARQLGEIRRRKLALVFQMHHLLPQCTALENVLLPTLGCRDAGAAGRAASLLQRVGLGHRMNHRPAALSLGERQRVAVARAMINSPRLLLADEPTGSLDARSAGEIADLLVALRDDDGVALVVVTHSERLAGRMQDVAELAGGRLHPRGGRT